MDLSLDVTSGLGQSRLTRLLRRTWLTGWTVDLWLDERCSPRFVQGVIAEVSPTGALLRMASGLEVVIDSIDRMASNAGGWTRES